MKYYQSVSLEPYKLFEALNFARTFAPQRRKVFAIKLALVGKMVKPKSWAEWLNAIKEDYILDEASKERSRKLFGERIPLIPKIISQDKVVNRSRSVDHSDERVVDPKSHFSDCLSLTNTPVRKENNASIERGPLPSMSNFQMHDSIVGKKRSLSHVNASECLKLKIGEKF